jgi:hypothetical protein
MGDTYPALPQKSRSLSPGSRSSPGPTSQPPPCVECTDCHSKVPADKLDDHICLGFSPVPALPAFSIPTGATGIPLPTPSDGTHPVQSRPLAAGVSDLLQSTLSWGRTRVLGQVKESKPERSGELLDLTGKLRRLNKFPSAHGGYADIWVCTYSTSRGRDQV